MQTLADDLRRALRRLRVQRWTALVACGMLGDHVGNAHDFRPHAAAAVPYRDPAALVSLYVGTGPREMLPYVTRDVVRAWLESGAFGAVAGVVRNDSLPAHHQR